MRGDFFLFFHGHIVADIGRKEKPCFLFFAAAYTGMSAMLNAKKEETHLEKNDTAVKICGTTEGRLPGSCAPLAFPYVPVQCDNPARYSQQDALQAGTLFPGLNLPFHADMETRFPAANTALSELMALDFAIDELGLYLTTHRDDQEVLALYWSYIKLAREGREKYQEKYGDIPNQFAADAYDGVHAVAEALKEAGLGVDADPTEAAEKLSKAMLKITVDGLTGKLTWNDKGQVQKEPTAYVITDGKYVQA